MINILKLCLYGCLLSLNPMKYFKVKLLTCYLSTDTSTRKKSVYPAFDWKVSPNHLENKIIEVSFCVGYFMLYRC